METTSTELTRLVHPDRLPDLARDIIKLARLAARAGVAAPELIEVGPEQWLDRGNGAGCRVHEVRINWPAVIAFPGGWQFLGAVDHRAGGMLAGTVPAELRNPDPYHCDHCGRAVRRNVTYYAQAADGRIIQLGGDCLQQYLGIDGEALGGYLAALREAESCEYDGWGGIGGGPDGYRLEQVLAVALHEVDSRGYCKAGGGGPCTGDWVSGLLHEQFNRYISLDANLQAVARVAEIVGKYDGQVDAVISWAAGLDPSGSEYLYNVRLALSRGWVPLRLVNIAVSAAWAYRREQGERRAAMAAPEPLQAETGKRLTLAVKVLEVRAVDSCYGPRAIVKGTADGRAVCWWTEPGRFDEGGEYVIKGTVKGINEFKGRRACELNRVQLVPAKAAAAAACGG